MVVGLNGLLGDTGSESGLVELPKGEAMFKIKGDSTQNWKENITEFEEPFFRF